MAAEAGELEEEVEAVLATFPDAARWAPARRLLTCTFPHLTLRLTVPAAYPAQPPVVGTDTPRGVSKGQLGELVAALDAVFDEADGEPVLLQAAMLAEEGSGEWAPAGAGASSDASASGQDPQQAAVSIAAGAAVKRHPCPTIHSGEAFVDRKSTFQGHAAAVHSMEDVGAVMEALLADRHIARATHNMMAFRFQDAAGVWHSDNDEDGEDAAGARLSMLLELMDVTAAVVVVTRWYGGVHLGPSRFKHINNAARQALIDAGLSGREK